MQFVKKDAAMASDQDTTLRPLDQYRPVFQPIVSLTNRQVFGYESLGRLATNGGLVSLGPLFNPAGSEPVLSVADRLRLDRHLRRQALERFATEAAPNTKLFINIAPSFILKHVQELGNQVPTTIQMVEDLGIDPKRIVIELTETAVEHGVAPLMSIIEAYRAAQFSIAIDDVGAEASNLDRIGLFRPDILKLDRHLIQMAVTDQAFRSILHSLSRLAESLGASMLFEGIQTPEELDISLRSGARYVQGFLFSEGLDHFARANTYDAFLHHHLRFYVQERRREIQKRSAWERDILGDLVGMRFEAEYRGEKIFLDLKRFCGPETPIKKIWITDLLGNQISPNYRFYAEGCVEDESAFGLNWSTRPYFFDHLRQTKQKSGWTLSDIYQDINEHRFVRTFSHRFGRKALLFIDIPVESEV